MLAARAVNVQVVKYCLHAGANKELHNKEGYTALDMATKFNHDEIVSLLTRDEKPSSAELTPLAKLWSSALDGSMTAQDVIQFLTDLKIDSFQTVIVAHNILLIPVRKRVMKLDQIQNFQKNSDYVVMKLSLN